jgi:hypothetical protein
MPRKRKPLALAAQRGFQSDRPGGLIAPESSPTTVQLQASRGARALKRAILESWHDCLISDDSADALIRFFGLGGA